MALLRHPALRGVAVYGLATGLAAVLTLVQTRVLWRALAPADFGLWALVDPLLLPAASLLLFGIDHSIIKQVRVDCLPLRIVIGTLLVSTLPASVLFLLAAGLVARFVLHLAWTDALVLTMAGESLILLIQTAFRASHDVVRFAALLLSRNVLYLAVLLLVRAEHAAAPLSIGVVFIMRGGCVIVVSLAAVAVLRPVLRIDRARYADAVRYGFPLLLTTFIYSLTDMADRWFLATFSGVAAVGVYALHLKVAAILSQAIVIPFGMWFPPERFRYLDAPDGGRQFFIRVATVLMLICGYLSGAVWLARDPVLSLIAPGVAASPLVLACCLGGVTCLALSQALNVGLLLPGHTAKNAICTVWAVIATVLAAATLVPLFGATGAAVSRLLGGVVLVAATAAWSHRVFPIAFPFVLMVLYVVASVAALAGIDCGASGHGLSGLTLALLAWSAASSLFAVMLWRGSRAVERATPYPSPAL